MISLGQNFRFGYYDVPPMERLSAIQKAGFASVMFWWGDEFDAVDGDKHTLARAALAMGLKINTIHFPSTHADYLWREDECEAYADLIIQALEDCARYGAENLVLHMTRALITPPYNQLGLNALGRAVAAAEKLGVNIAAENTRFPAYNRYVYENIPSKRLTLCYDTGHEHCYTKGADILAQFGERLSTTHIHDNDGQSDQHHLMGEGNIDFALVFERLAQSGVKYYNLESYCNKTSKYYGKLTVQEFLDLSFRTLTEKLNFCREHSRRG